MNSSLADINATAKYLDSITTKVFCEHQIMPYHPESIIIYSVTLIICCIGVPLNGIVIRLLGFHVKRNPFTVLILNLAIADFGFLTLLAMFCICNLILIIIIITAATTMTTALILGISLAILSYLSIIMYTNGLFLLAAISIDRCVCVFFPIWHRCSRPKHLSPAVCALLWICSVLFVTISIFIPYAHDNVVFSTFYFIVICVLYLPLIIISTLILFVKICLKPKQIKRGRLLVMILITLLCFLIFTLPLYIYSLNALYPYYMTNTLEPFYVYRFIILGASLNSTVNPVIYYLVGRKKKAQSRESIKVIFQRVFKEDEAPESAENAPNTIETPL